MKEKKQYQSPALEVIALDESDIVTVSNGDTLFDVSELLGNGGSWGNKL